MARILVVDDSPVTRALLADFLMMLGHKMVGEAENLAQTLSLLAEKKPDLVTLDLSMEKEDGFQVLQGLREADPKVKVLIVSANTQQDVYDQLLKEGASGYLKKPFSITDLSAAVEKAAGPA